MIPTISQPTSRAGTMLSKPPRTVRLTNLSQFVPTPSMFGHKGQRIPEMMKYGALWDGHQRQYLTAPPMKPMETNQRLKCTALLMFTPACSSAPKTRTDARLRLADDRCRNQAFTLIVSAMAIFNNKRRRQLNRSVTCQLNELPMLAVHALLSQTSNDEAK